MLPISDEEVVNTNEMYLRRRTGNVKLRAEKKKKKGKDDRQRSQI
jgi:hypothetical protein